MDAKFSPEHVAPCGINCGVCKAYLAYSHGVPYQKGKVIHCEGCLVRDKNCAFIKRDCPRKVGKKLRFCHECPEMPCKHLVKLDELYRARYGMSMVENLRAIKEDGMEAFLKNQAERYCCPCCGDVVSVHDGKCYACGFQRPKPKGSNPKYRWVPNKK